MRTRFLRPALLAAALFGLAACGRGEEAREGDDGGLNVTTNATAPSNAVETAPAVAPPSLPTGVEETRAPLRNVRDGPGEERGPEYEGARSAATALPSQGDNATAGDATPPPPAPPPAGPQNPGTRS